MKPLFWLGLAKSAGKISKKLFLIGGALSFFLLILPITLPWQIQKTLYPEYLFKQFVKVLPPGDNIALAERSELPVFKKTLPFPVHDISGIAPDKLSANVIKKLKSHNVILICSNRELEKFFPNTAGKRYVIGKYHIFCYYSSRSVSK